jgi:hypothetical protein
LFGRVSFIKKQTKKRKKFQKILTENFKKENVEKFLLKDFDECKIFPNLAVCVGHGKPLTSTDYSTVNNFAVFTGQKMKKSKSNLIRK